VKRTRPSIRLRLTLLYAGLLVAATTLLLATSWWLLDGHLDRTLPPAYADEVMRRLALQYALGVLGAGLVALGLGWAIAGHALAPLRRIVATARRVADGRLEERVGLDGPRDELRELSETLDDMLDRLEGAMEAQRRFVANASHELRTPLTVIRTETDVTLADPSASCEELRAMGRVVLETTDRMEDLLEGLLLLARSSRGGLRSQLVDIDALARRVVAGAEEQAVSAGVRLSFEAAPATARGEEVLLERMLVNLVDNAVRHNVSGGFAGVRVSTAGDTLTLEVANGGAVIAPEALPRLTEPFQRLGRSGNRVGSGLGLSIVRAVAQAHGGSLELIARPQGGLTARVVLPAAGAAPVAAARPSALIRN
jgi:signal transduction histidine kinase